MNYLQIIETRAAEALAEIKAMADAARKEINASFEFINRSRGQKRRFALKRQQEANHERG